MTKNKPRSVFVLVRSDWMYNDEYWDGDFRFLRGYATRAEAEAAIPGRPLEQWFGRAEQTYQIVEVPIQD